MTDLQQAKELFDQRIPRLKAHSNSIDTKIVKQTEDYTLIAIRIDYGIKTSIGFQSNLHNGNCVQVTKEKYIDDGDEVFTIEIDASALTPIKKYKENYPVQYAEVMAAAYTEAAKIAEQLKREA